LERYSALSIATVILPLSALVKIISLLLLQNYFVALCNRISLDSDKMEESIFFKYLYNCGMEILINVCLSKLWKTILLSISLMNSCIATFLLRWDGRQNLSPNCKRVEISCGITLSDRLMNHLLLVCFKGSFDLSKNFWGSTLMLMLLWPPDVLNMYLLENGCS